MDNQNHTKSNKTAIYLIGGLLCLVAIGFAWKISTSENKEEKTTISTSKSTQYGASTAIENPKTQNSKNQNPTQSSHQPGIIPEKTANEDSKSEESFLKKLQTTTWPNFKKRVGENKWNIGIGGAGLSVVVVAVIFMIYPLFKEIDPTSRNIKESLLEEINELSQRTSGCEEELVKIEQQNKDKSNPKKGKENEKDPKDEKVKFKPLSIQINGLKDEISNTDDNDPEREDKEKEFKERLELFKKLVTQAEKILNLPKNLNGPSQEMKETLKRLLYPDLGSFDSTMKKASEFIRSIPKIEKREEKKEEKEENEEEEEEQE